MKIALICILVLIAIYMFFRIAKQKPLIGTILSSILVFITAPFALMMSAFSTDSPTAPFFLPFLVFIIIEAIPLGLLTISFMPLFNQIADKSNKSPTSK